MADVVISVQQITVAGIAPTYQGSLSTSDRYRIPNDGLIVVHAKKSGSGACTVTIDTPKTVGGLSVQNPTVIVPATTGDMKFGPFPPDIYNDIDGYVDITFSEVTGLTFGAFRL